jgi:hypothetical protein
VQGADLPPAARRALRIHGVVVAACATLAVVNALVAIRTLGRVDLDQRWIGVLVAAVAFVIAATIGVVLGKAVNRVRTATGTLRPQSTVGLWLFLVAIVVGFLAGEAVRSVVLDRYRGRQRRPVREFSAALTMTASSRARALSRLPICSSRRSRSTESPESSSGVARPSTTRGSNSRIALLDSPAAYNCWISRTRPTAFSE